MRINTSSIGPRSFLDPQIVAGGSDVHVVWHDDRSGRHDVHFNRSFDAGTTWLDNDVRLDTGPAGGQWSLYPRIAQSGSSVYVAWEDGRNSNQGRDDIYFNIPFGALTYGDPTAGSGGVAPELATTGTPVLNSIVSVDMTRGRGGATGALWIGAGPSSKTSVALFGGTALVAPTVSVPVLLNGAPGASGAGSFSVPVSLPNLPALVGANVNFQAVFLDPGAAFGISMTSGIEMWIG